MQQYFAALSKGDTEAARRIALAPGEGNGLQTASMPESLPRPVVPQSGIADLKLSASNVEKQNGRESAVVEATYRLGDKSVSDRFELVWIPGSDGAAGTWRFEQGLPVITIPENANYTVSFGREPLPIIGGTYFIAPGRYEMTIEWTQTYLEDITKELDFSLSDQATASPSEVLVSQTISPKDLVLTSEGRAAVTEKVKEKLGVCFTEFCTVFAEQAVLESWASEVARANVDGSPEFEFTDALDLKVRWPATAHVAAEGFPVRTSKIRKIIESPPVEGAEWVATVNLGLGEAPAERQTNGGEADLKIAKLDLMIPGWSE